jgi:outer membrane autotransporter protein
VAGYSGTVTGKAVTVDGKNSLVVYLDGQTPVTPTTPTTPTTPGVTTPSNGFATTPNAIASLRGLGGYSGFSDDLLNLYNASKAIGSREEANKAGEQLSPVQNSAASSTAAAASSGALAVVSNHMDSTRLARNGSTQSGIATGDDAQEWAVWGQPFYGSARQGMIDNVSGYSAHYGGVVLGADRQIADSWRVGGAFSYAHSSVNGRDNLTGSHTDVDAWSGIAYASWSGNPLYVNLTASVSTQKYDSQRQIGFDGFAGQANGSFNGQQVMTKAEVGYPIFFAQGTTLTPLAALGYSYLHQDDYKEHSDQGAALKVDSSHTQSVRSSLGAKLEHSWSTGIGDVVPFVQAMWTHEYDRSRTATSASYAADALGETRFTSLGATPVSDTADIGAGVALVQSDDLSISARYDLSTAPHFDAQTVSLRLRKSF